MFYTDWIYIQSNGRVIRLSIRDKTNARWNRFQLDFQSDFGQRLMKHIPIKSNIKCVNCSCFNQCFDFYFFFHIYLVSVSWRTLCLNAYRLHDCEWNFELTTLMNNVAIARCDWCEQKCMIVLFRLIICIRVTDSFPGIFILIENCW